MPSFPCHFCLVLLPEDYAGSVCRNCLKQLGAMSNEKRMELLNGYWQAIELRRQTDGLNAASHAHKVFAQDLSELAELAKREYHDRDGGDDPLGFNRVPRG
jgi:hypothetical protein